MANNLVLIIPRCAERKKSDRLRDVLAHTLGKLVPSEKIETADQLHALRGKRILFAVVLGSSGINLEYYNMLKKIRNNEHMFEGCIGALLVDGLSNLYTKHTAQELVFAANMSGCAFIGRPLVEGTTTLDNFHIIAKQQHLTAYGAYMWAAQDLWQRLITEKPLRPDKRKLLVLHSSRKSISNTYALWRMVEANLTNMQIQEISLRLKNIQDCAGCSYETCMYFGSQGSCLYGGTISDDIYPALEQCTDLLLLCPNYNDALPAHLTAFINRLTAMYLQKRFYDKRLHAIIVSGYSGSDIIAGQLIAAMCMNKSFFLPPRFSLMETAQEKDSIKKIDGIEATAAAFAQRIGAYPV